MSTNYDIDYNDQRFQQVESDKNSALSDLESTYDEMIGASDKYYQDQIDASKAWAEQQKQLQQEKTDFAIEKIEQQKAQAKKDYTKEQSGAYVDWQKQSNQYGANAEAMAAQGMAGTGYSESSQVSMYNTYQNRVTAARESYQQAILNYNNAITEARLQNNSLLAEIAYNALQQQLELSLQGFQYKNQLVLDKTKQKLEVDQMYYSRYQDVLAQINHENSLAEQVRQFNAQLAEEQRQYNTSLAEEQRQFNALHSGGSVSSGGSGGSVKRSGGGSVKKPPSTKKTNKERIEADTGVKPKAATPEKGSNSQNGFTGSTYSEAVSYMKKYGVSGDKASGVMTKSEWVRRKASGSTSGHVAKYSSYADYLKDYCEYAISASAGGGSGRSGKF